MYKRGLKGLAIGALVVFGVPAQAQSVFMTGANWYTLDSGAHYTGGYANTYGGDTYSRNLYMTEDVPVGQGTLLNSLNLTTLPTRIQVDLTTPGTYTFQMYCNGESSGVTAFWGLNLFFDSNDLKPGISVKNVVDVAGFQTINPVGTPTLDPLSMGLVQSGSGSGSQPVYIGGNVQIRLTAYSTWDTLHYNADRVDNFSDDAGHGNGTKDQVIEFTLQSSPVPEPASSLVLGGATLMVGLRRRFRASKK